MENHVQDSVGFFFCSNNVSYHFMFLVVLCYQDEVPLFCKFVLCKFTFTEMLFMTYNMKQYIVVFKIMHNSIFRMFKHTNVRNNVFT